MNSKTFKKLTIFLFVIFSFFGFSSQLKAFTANAIYPWPKDINGKSYHTVKYTLKGLANQRSYSTGIYMVDGMQAYCIEPGAELNSSKTYYGNETYQLKDFKMSGFIDSDNQRNMIAQILTFAINVGKVKSKEYYEGAGAKIAREIFADQGLIWEVVKGERTSFVQDEPDKQGNYCSFYRVTQNVWNCSQGLFTYDTAVEYFRILNAIRGSFNRLNPGNGNNKFSPSDSNANVVSLSWNGSKYSLTINDNNFKYWKISETSGLEVSKTDDSITISSDKPISIDNAKKVSIKIYNKDDPNRDLNGTTVYKDNSFQDLVAIGGVTHESYIKVYTPSYQLKVIKKAKLDGAVLSGAKFNVCTNSSCTTILGTITTDKNGVATYAKIPYPGTYYVKEITAPAGYELDSTPKAVSITHSNISGTASYGTISLSNKNKEFNLTKKTVDENNQEVELDDGCGTDTYTGPEFEIKENGNSLYFKKIKDGEYQTVTKDIEGATTKLRTCKGKFKVYTLKSCKYTISETKPPEGLTLPSSPVKNIDVCGSDKNVSFTNGFAGLEFQKKNEDGEFVSGGKFSLQMKINNVYKDMLLKQIEEGSYEYDSKITENNSDATYIILTKDGIARISKLPPGEYRVAEKEAPKGYELIEDKNSKALVTIKDSDKDGYYLVEMIDQKSNKYGSSASAELVVTIITGRKILNYAFIISSLVALLVIAIIIRKKIKK